LQYAGGTCYTFEWDSNSSANSEHEANPDVYIKYLNQVYRSANTRYVTARQADGSAHGTISWRNGNSGSADAFVANECTTAGACWIWPGGYLLPSTDINSTTAKISMALDSAEHSLTALGSNLSSNITMEIPDSECGTSACAASDTRYVIPSGLMTSGHHVTHEIAHLIQMQRFSRSSLRDDCSNGSSSWLPDGPEYESCATTEGFADYAGASAWYDGQVLGTTPLLGGFDYEDATPFNNFNCTVNRFYPLQVSKAFWDLDDQTNENGVGVAASYNDRDTFYTWDIAYAWTLFAAGTGNRQNFESDGGSPENGVNVRDYHANTSSAWFGSSSMFQSMLEHNCIQSQDDL
jgi:hypothetical protein